MAVTRSTIQTAMVAGQDRACSMPFSSASMPVMCAMYMAAASILLGTDVYTSVSLFAGVHILATLLLVSLVIIISLLLTCLTGLIRLESLVGLTEVTIGLATYGVTQGD